jgi:hypothetical protein
MELTTVGTFDTQMGYNLIQVIILSTSTNVNGLIGNIQLDGGIGNVEFSHIPQPNLYAITPDSLYNSRAGAIPTLWFDSSIISNTTYLYSEVTVPES